MRILFLLLFVLASCQNISVQDRSPESIEVNHLRVETEICGRHGVGLNGCFFPSGKIEENLKVFAVAKGSLRVVGCGIDKSLRYDMENGPWFDVELKGTVLVNDCVLSLYQAPEFPKQADLEFPVKGYIGSVFLGRCLEGQTCTFEEYQDRGKFSYQLQGDIDELSTFTVLGCGKTLVPVTQMDDAFEVEIGDLIEGKGCVVYFLIKNSKMLLKSVHWISRYDVSTILMKAPVVVKKRFEGDNSTMAYIQDGKVRAGNKGKVKDGIVRFYTSSGRSLVVEFKNGAVQWTK